ncbi:MAG: HAD family hydrolase [Bdellovibrionia bacterium]
MKYDSVIFDLDGTLWNACGSVARGWNEALQQLGIERTVTAQEIANVCGKPQDECVRAVLPEITQAIWAEAFPVINREEENAVRTHGGELYPGVSEGLNLLGAKVPLFVVSNCTDWYLDGFLNQFAFHNTFQDTECYGRTGQQKGKNLKDLVNRNRLKNPVYVGDTVGDQTAAREAGTEFLFAAYGFGKIIGVECYQSFEDLLKRGLRHTNGFQM